MKRSLETSDEKVQKICDALKRETLEPAQQEAQSIIIESQRHAEEIVAEAREEAARLLKEARAIVEQEKNVFHSSLQQAARMSMESLKQEIERNLFNPELHEAIVRHTSSPDLVAKLLSAIVGALEKEGLAANLTALIPSTVSAKEVAHFLSHSILEKLKERGLHLGEFQGGAKVRIEDRKMILDISDREIQELLSRYVRKDFRALLFGES